MAGDFSAMLTFKDVVMIKDDGRERAVRITVDAPNPEALDIQHLGAGGLASAQKETQNWRRAREGTRVRVVAI